MKKIFLLAFLCIGSQMAIEAQELYVFSEPASNMPAGTLGLKFSAMRGKERHHYEGRSQRYMPELMLGFSKKLMVHAGTTFSNMYSKDNRWESVYIYGKYRFLSIDDVHRHFRMAAFAQGAYARNEPYFEDIGLQGDRSGIQGGLIATQLIGKFAGSATGSFIQTFHDNKNFRDQALNYSLSAGLLVLPFEYKSYRQLNLNIYAELLGQKLLESDAYYIDFAPAIQFIVNSNSKLNFGYRFQLDGNQFRSMERYFQVSLEHTFYNVLKK